MAEARMLPTFSVVIEWDNARLSEVGRARQMLRVLRAQLSELTCGRNAQPDVVILYDKNEIEHGLVETVTFEEAGADQWPAAVKIIPTDGLEYYEQKNLGAQQSDSEVIVFLDSDVIPHEGWLRKLLETFQDPSIGVVGGMTYIEHDDLYSKAFALYWLFPFLSEAGNGLRKADVFYANNLAFRRDVFEAQQFPKLASFRGQCQLLLQTLKRRGVEVVVHEGARVSHPAPNGFKHFVTRALAHGHDDVVLARARAHLGLSTPGHAHLSASPVGAAKRYLFAVSRMLARTARYYRTVQLNPLTASAVLAIGGSYRALKLAAELVACVRPGVIRRHVAL